MNEKDLMALIRTVNQTLNDDPEKEVSGEFVCENGKVYRYQTI